jgi:biotin transporter BioY
MPHDVFVSYTSQDKPTADAICNALENRGIRIWIAPRDVLPGTDWGGAIIDAINSSRLMILVYSASANESPQIKREVERAVHRGIPLIPFRIQDVPMSKTLEYFISTPHWLDALTQPFQQHLDRLAETAKLILEQSGVELPDRSSRAYSTDSPPIEPITSSDQVIQGIGRWVSGAARAPTLAQLFVAPSDRLGNIGLIAAAAVLLSLVSQFKLGPIWLQPLGVLLIGATLGSRNGALAAIAYIALGVIGLPVFGGGMSAWGIIDYRAPYAQHALGHLIGLVAAAFSMGWFAERRSWDRSVPTAAVLAGIGAVVIFLTGRLWSELLALFMKQPAYIDHLPSLLMLVATVAVTAFVLPAAWKSLEQRQRADSELASAASKVG